MGNIYTEQENTWAAQISNCVITEEQIVWARKLFDLSDDEAPTFRQIVEACEIEDSTYNLWFREMEGDEPQFFEDAKTEDFGNWKIVGIYDDNDNSGFYAVAIETGEYTTNNVENGVIFSARGTEPVLWKQMYLDLVNTDLNIFNSDVTEQELVMYGFLDKEFAALLEEKGYSNLATTGHSLGGYLSFSAAGHIMVKGEHASEIFMQGTNIDGPGVTEENLEVNADTYAKLDPYLTHYHYTYIGGLLNPICSNYVSIFGASNSTPYEEGFSPEFYENLKTALGEDLADRINSIYSYVNAQTGKHALASLQFDGDNYDTSYVENNSYDITTDTLVRSISLYGIKGLLLETVVMMITLQLYEESLQNPADIEFDLWANIADKATQIADDNDQLQIFVGGVVKLSTELINDVVDMSDEYITNKYSFVPNKRRTVVAF